KIGVGNSKERENRLLAKARADSAEDMRALDTQAKQAAAAASGDLDTKVGEAFASYGQYDKAVEAISRGIKKGGVVAVDEAYLHLGQALYAQKKYPDRSKALKPANAPSQFGQSANLWASMADED